MINPSLALAPPGVGAAGMRGPQTICPHTQCEPCAGPMDSRRTRGLLFLLGDSSLQVFGWSANNNSSGTLYNSALQNLLGDRSPTGRDREGNVFRAGDLKMINDFSQGELCPPPPTCCMLPPSFASLFAGGGGGGGGPLKEKCGLRALCWKGRRGFLL